MWPRILELQSEAYTDIEPESLETLKSRRDVSPDLCFVYSVDGDIAAYILAHGWHSEFPPKLFQPLKPDTRGDILLIHDLAVSGRHTGSGIGRILAQHVLQSEKSHQYRKALLVSIQDSQDLWKRMGFNIIAGKHVDPCYGVGAVIMEKSLAPGQQT